MFFLFYYALDIVITIQTELQVVEKNVIRIGAED